MRIVPASPQHLEQWGVLRFALWPWDDAEDHAEEAETLYLSGDLDRAAFVAIGEGGMVLGFAEATIRRDYVEGCESSPVAFLEGIYVRTEARLGGIARALSEQVELWGRHRGCSEYASNALLENVDSHAFHAAVGFLETVQVVYFRKDVS